MVGSIPALGASGMVREMGLTRFACPPYCFYPGSVKAAHEVLALGDLVRYQIGMRTTEHGSIVYQLRLAAFTRENRGQHSVDLRLAVHPVGGANLIHW